MTCGATPVRYAIAPLSFARCAYHPPQDSPENTANAKLCSRGTDGPWLENIAMEHTPHAFEQAYTTRYARLLSAAADFFTSTGASPATSLVLLRCAPSAPISRRAPLTLAAAAASRRPSTSRRWSRIRRNACRRGSSRGLRATRRRSRTRTRAGDL